MSTLDVRNNSAMMKRAEQLKRWEESDTNRAPATPRTENGRRIKFSSGCVFLAACLSSDKDEVLLLLSQGADINTANVDGLTGLHQACIDDNLEMVEFLVEHGADINRQDNEGWTPLHATASCGFVSIARYLVESGADVAAVNSDGDLALDLAIDTQHVPMIDYMSKVVQELNIDVEQARKAEEMAMLNDAKKWLRSDASEVDRPHPKTGATAMHVAAAKGYTKVLSLLLAGRANVDKQDNDGWTPLHGAAHWGQKETAEMLIESLADMDIRNYAGQTCIDIADRKMVKFLEELRANKRNKRRPSSQISRISDTIENHVDKTPTKIVRVEVRTDNTKDADNMKSNANNLQQQLYTNTDQQTVEDEAPWRRKTPRTQNDSLTKNQVPDKEVGNKTTTTTATTNTNAETNDVILRRTQSFENDQKKPPATPVNTIPPASITTTTTTTSGTNTPTSATNNAPTVAGVIPPIRRSFVPPVRDEESETQRKAHAKRVRETRRSTQGVTLDEIKSAEELVKKKNLGMNNNNNNNNNSNFKLEDVTSGVTFPAPNSTIIPSAPAVLAAANLTGSQRRISASNNSINASNQSLNSIGRPVSAPANETTTTTAYLTHARKYEASAAPTTPAVTSASSSTSLSSNSITSTPATTTSSSSSTITSASTTAADDKDNDKENDNRSAHMAIQRRRKPKRRSTGVVHIDMDEIDPDRHESSSANDNEDKEKESGSERTTRSRLGSTASNNAASNEISKAANNSSSSNKTENGDGIDYKALWEAAKLENDKLKQMLKQKDDEVVQTRATLERFTNAQLEVYKTDNHRLKEENAALIRVISKLSK